MLAEQDPVKKAALYAAGNSADYFLTSVCSIAETGQFVLLSSQTLFRRSRRQNVGDLTGTRVGGVTSGGVVIIVAGTNKIVKTVQDMTERAYKFCLPLESARVRVAYGIPASKMNNYLQVNQSNPFASGEPRVRVYFIKEVLGF